MAKNNNLTDFLTDLADGIRAKKGTTGTINPQNFRSEIASIKTEKPEQTKTVTITENGTITIIPDSGKVLTAVTVTTNVQAEKPTLNAPAIALNGSNITITDNLNGNFVTGYEVYDNGTILLITTSKTFDLTNHIHTSGTHAIKVKAKGTNFNTSPESNAVTWTLQLQTPVISLVSGTTIQIDTIDEHATTIEVFADGTSIGSVSKQ